jgi:hypothetical protein
MVSGTTLSGQPENIRGVGVVSAAKKIGGGVVPVEKL